MKTQHKKNLKPIYRNIAYFNKFNDTKITKIQSVEPEIFIFKELSKNSTKKHKAPTWGIWLRETGARSKVKADCDGARVGYEKWIGSGLGLPSDIEEISPKGQRGRRRTVGQGREL